MIKWKRTFCVTKLGILDRIVGKVLLPSKLASCQVFDRIEKRKRFSKNFTGDGTREPAEIHALGWAGSFGASGGK